MQWNKIIDDLSDNEAFLTQQDTAFGKGPSVRGAALVKKRVKVWIYSGNDVETPIQFMNAVKEYFAPRGLIVSFYVGHSSKNVRKCKTKITK